MFYLRHLKSVRSGKTPFLLKSVLSLTILLLTVVVLQSMLKLRSQASRLKSDTCESSDFRQQYLPPGIYEQLLRMAQTGRCAADTVLLRVSDRESAATLSVSGDFAERFSDLLTATMLNTDFYPAKPVPDSTAYQKYKPAEYEELKKSYQSIWSDLVYFPIPSREINFEDTFGAPREYGGHRTHEGCDLFGRNKTPGYYPVLSITDGIVENIGWLPLGGYRIGIRAPKGGYFYYAHLSTYEKEFQTGEEIQAGDILGYMGNTGYGEEGTTAMFPVHLHLGIYIRTPHCEELSVNPYWVLKAISKKIRNYSY